MGPSVNNPVPAIYDGHMGVQGPNLFYKIHVIGHIITASANLMPLNQSNVNKIEISTS